jgi:hypothetical protein
MLAHYWLHHVGLHPPSFSLAHAEAWACEVLAQVHRGWCAVRGHDLVLHFEPRRLSLTCADCGWESAGWILDPAKRMPVRLGRSLRAVVARPDTRRPLPRVRA